MRRPSDSRGPSFAVAVGSGGDSCLLIGGRRQITRRGLMPPLPTQIGPPAKCRELAERGYRYRRTREQRRCKTACCEMMWPAAMFVTEPDAEPKTLSALPRGARPI
ncbi:hypothetical protein SKAU_G00206300 [Synaphobranchus kaupii]|uniref:Uncharacterized protein n=1 Tax=Synaphobranchus kaupii TaxID=118154 RepID=A0A9Q1IYB4_SYNKA|nr:hypothetical protein SKAU_G00206300 [Synaphobranchus kaupii]